MQPGHEEVAFTLVPDLEVLPAELLDDSNTSAQEMTVKLRRNTEKIMSICLTRIPIWLVLENFKFTTNQGNLPECADFSWKFQC